MEEYNPYCLMLNAGQLAELVYSNELASLDKVHVQGLKVVQPIAYSIPQALEDEVTIKFGNKIRIVNVYGTSECGVFMATKSASDSLGSPMVQCQVKVKWQQSIPHVVHSYDLYRLQLESSPDENSNPSSGEILAKVPAPMLGYLNRPEETKKYFTEDGFARTGDLGIATSDGSIKFLSRMHNLFK